MPEFTRQEWRIAGSDIVVDGRGVIAHVPNAGRGSTGVFDAQANRLLIAAAPAMYEALNTVLVYLVMEGEDRLARLVSDVLVKAGKTNARPRRR